MAATVTDLKAWLDSLPTGATVAVDEGGLTLILVETAGEGGGSGCWSPYYELGGVPEDGEEDDPTCPRCGKKSDTVEEQYSFGYYAGILCRECAISGFSDHCGLLAGEPMGDPQTLDDYGHDGQD